MMASSRATSLPRLSPKPPGLDEVALHVDDDQRRVRGVEREVG